MLRRTFLFAALFLLLPIRDALAWNATGHMLTAMFAYRELDPATRKKVNDILKQHPQYEALSKDIAADSPDLGLIVFARAATWPDMVRSPRNPFHATDHHANWHYINFPVSFDGTLGKTPVSAAAGAKPNDILSALVKCESDLKAGTPAERAIALSWFEHLVGDIHQPLHATALYSQDFPKGDKGGNEFLVGTSPGTSSLHSYWDEILGKTSTTTGLKSQLKLLRASTKLKRPALADELAHTDYDTWAKESRDLAAAVAYGNGKVEGLNKKEHEADPDSEAPELPANYRKQALAVAKERAALAGYRMADKLKQALTP